jgi:hypothetical protein
MSTACRVEFATTVGALINVTISPGALTPERIETITTLFVSKAVADCPITPSQASRDLRETVEEVVERGAGAGEGEEKEDVAHSSQEVLAIRAGHLLASTSSGVEQSKRAELIGRIAGAFAKGLSGSQSTSETLRGNLGMCMAALVEKDNAENNSRYCQIV